MASPPAHPVQTLGNYVLRKKLGAGAMGQVWLAHDKVLDREVAVKVLLSGAGNKRMVQDFLREAQAAAKLNHPNTVTIYQIGRQGDKVFIAMEYVEAGSLSDELRDKGPLPWREATQAIRDAAAGLQAAHERGMVHRDIKPANLMRSARGLVKVVDFGLAKARTSDAEATQTQAGTILGSPAYMSPEQCRGERADARSDLYSLICSYYQLLTRKTPFAASELTAAMYQHCHAPFPDIRATGINVPDGVCRILEKGSRKKPEERYQSAADLIADLDVVLHAPEASHTFDGKAAGSKSQPKPNAGGTSLGSILKGKGVVGKTSWAAIIGLLAAGLWLARSHFRPPPPLTDSGPISVLEKPVVTDQTPRAGVVSASVPETHRIIDVLKLIDVDRDTLHGKWKRTDGALAATDKAVIQIPYHTPAEYDFNVVFAPGDTEGHGITLILSKGQRQFFFSLSAKQFWDGFACVKDWNGGTSVNPAWVQSAVHPVSGQKYTLEVRVRNDHVEAFLGGLPVVSYKTDFTDLTICNDHFKAVAPGTLGLAAWDAPTTIYSAQVTEINGSGTLGVGNRVVDLMPLVNPATDAVSGTWHLNGGKLLADPVDTGHVALRLPYTPSDDEEYDLAVRFTFRAGGSSGVHGRVSHAGKRFDLMLNKNGTFGLEKVRGKNAPENETTGHLAQKLEVGVQHEFVIRVRSNEVGVLVDGEKVLNHPTDYSDLDDAGMWPKSDDALGLGSSLGGVEFGTIEVHEIKGHGTLRDATVQDNGSSPVRVFPTEQAAKSVQLTPDGHHAYAFLTRGGMGQVVWNVGTSAEVRRLAGGFGRILPDGKRILVEWSGLWQTFDIATGKHVSDLTQVSPPGDTRGFLSADGTRLLIVQPQGDPLIALCDVNASKEINRIKTEAAVGKLLAFSPNGKMFVTADSSGGNVRAWDPETGKLVWEADNSSGCNQLGFSSDGRFLFKRPNHGDGDLVRTVVIFDAKTGGVVARCINPERGHDVVLTATGRYLFIASSQSIAGIRRFTLPSISAGDAPIVPDSSWPSDGQDLAAANTVVMSPDDHRILVGCKDGTIRLFDATSGKLLAKFNGEGEVQCVAFSGDGRYAISGDEKAVRVWRLP